MKKHFKLFLTLVLLVCCFCTLLACKDTDPTNPPPPPTTKSIALKDGTYSTRYELNAVVDTTNWKLVVTLSDDTKQEKSKADFTIEGLNTDTVGTRSLTVKYDGKAAVYSYTVTDDTVIIEYILDSYHAPRFWTEYLNNISEQDTPDGNGLKKDEFIELNNKFVVGASNVFKLMPQVSLYDTVNDIIIDIDEDSTMSYASKYSVKVDNTPVQDYSGYMTIDKTEVTFKPQAINKTIEITMTADEYLYGWSEQEILDELTVVVEFKVVDAYNIYTIDDLVRMDNRSNTRGGQIHLDDHDFWKQYKLDNNITAWGTATASIKGVVLQNDITIRRADLPDDFFFKNSAGQETLIFNDGFFVHESRNPDETFTFDGNYFTIDANDPSFILKVGDGLNYESNVEFLQEGSINPNAFLFSFGADVKGSNINGRSVMGDSIVNNVRFKGNAHRTSSANPNNWLTGGIIAVKMTGRNSQINNCLADSFSAFAQFEQMYAQQEYAATVKHTKIYDIYGYAFNLHKGTDVTIKGCEIKECGGPIFVVIDAPIDRLQGDDPYLDNDLTALGRGNEYCPNLNIVEDDSTSNNFINNISTELLPTGQDPWFVAQNATALIQQLNIMSIDLKAKTGNQKSLTNAKNNFNIVSVNMLQNPLTGNSPIRGTTQIGDYKLDMESEILDLMREMLPQLGGLPPVVTNSVDDDFGIFTGSGWEFVNPLPPSDALGDINTITNGKYITIYLAPPGGEYLGITLELFDVV